LLTELTLAAARERRFSIPDRFVPLPSTATHALDPDDDYLVAWRSPHASMRSSPETDT
jgi:hypothetical protein